MDAEWVPARDATGRRIWRDLLTPLAEELLSAADELAEVLAGVILEAIPEMARDEVMVNQQRLSTRLTLLDIAERLRVAADPRATELPVVTVSIVHAAVRGQSGLTPLLRTYRIGHARFWSWALDRLGAMTDRADVLAEAGGYLAEWMFAYIDAASALAEEAYQTEQDAWLRTALAARIETVEAILDGRERDPMLAGRRLRHDLSRQHIAAVVWRGDRDGGSPQADLDRAVRELGSRLGAEATLVIPSGEWAAQAWFSRRRPYADDELKDWRPESGVHVAVGSGGSGLPAFRRSHHEASHARRIAELTGTAEGLTRYRDVEILALATLDPELAAGFVERVLGPLTGTDEATVRAARTLAVFLEENRSRVRAASRLHIHANTVNYRVRQAEELLGRRVEDAGIELQVALALLPAARTLLRS